MGFPGPPAYELMQDPPSSSSDSRKSTRDRVLCWKVATYSFSTENIPKFWPSKWKINVQDQ